MQAILAHHGVALGVCLLVVVFAAAWLLARQATRSIARYRHEQHERFTSNPQ